MGKGSTIISCMRNLRACLDAHTKYPENIPWMVDGRKRLDPKGNLVLCDPKKYGISDIQSEKECNISHCYLILIYHPCLSLKIQMWGIYPQIVCVGIQTRLKTASCAIIFHPFLILTDIKWQTGLLKPLFEGYKDELNPKYVWQTNRACFALVNYIQQTKSYACCFELKTNT